MPAERWRRAVVEIGLRIACTEVMLNSTRWSFPSMSQCLQWFVYTKHLTANVFLNLLVKLLIWHDRTFVVKLNLRGCERILKVIS